MSGDGFFTPLLFLFESTNIQEMRGTGRGASFLCILQLPRPCKCPFGKNADVSRKNEVAFIKILCVCSVFSIIKMQR